MCSELFFIGGGLEFLLHRQLVHGWTGLIPQTAYWVWVGGLLVGADSETMTLVPTPREERNGISGTEDITNIKWQ